MSFLTDDNNTTETTNGMAAFKSTNSPLVDLFYAIGASRANELIVQQFLNAFAVYPLEALRILFWSRDVRGGAGEREVFRKCLKALAIVAPHVVARNLKHVPEYGRWDDLLDLPGLQGVAYAIISDGLQQGNSLCAKWMPRKGPKANELRKYLELTPKEYRHAIVGLSNTVEQQMCAKQWDAINFNGVPSIASKVYQNAFKRHQVERYTEWQAGLLTGETKVNAAAIFPHDVIRGLCRGDEATAEAQWRALPNYLEGASSILPMVDVSGSMTCSAGGSKMSCMEIAIALGLYISERQDGAFKDEVLTFESIPRFAKLFGTLADRVDQCRQLPWGGSTNVKMALEQLLKRAKLGGVPQEEMPKILLILSDMQFDENGNTGNISMMTRTLYSAAGYDMPVVVFWNLNAVYDNKPATANESGVVMVSGFSPAIMTAILKGDLNSMTPESVMLSVINSDRYARIL